MTTTIERIETDRRSGEWFVGWQLEYEQYRYPDDYAIVQRLIQDNLSDDLLTPHFKRLKSSNASPFFGHCVHATQALFYFFLAAELTIMRGKCQSVAKWHWWLQDATGKVLDVTAGQYDNSDYDAPYAVGKKQNSWTGSWQGRPLVKTFHLMQRVQNSARLYR